MWAQARRSLTDVAPGGIGRTSSSPTARAKIVAFSENQWYFLSTATEANIEAARAELEYREGFLNLSTLGHGMYTGIFGAGLGLGTWSRTRRGQLGWPLLGLGVAILLHAFYNGFAISVLVLKYGYNEVANLLLAGGLPANYQRTNDVADGLVILIDYAMIPVFLGAILLGARYQKRVLRYELAEETKAGLITSSEFETVSNYTSRLKWHARLLIAGVRTGNFEQWRVVRNAHHELAELAFLKWRLRRVGGPATELERRRRQITALRQQQGGELQTAGQAGA